MKCIGCIFFTFIIKLCISATPGFITFPEIDYSELKNEDNKKHTTNDNFDLLILHTNDMHSRILETSLSSTPTCRDEICYGGFARLKQVSMQLKEEYEKQNWSVLFLNAGDNFQGSPFYSIHKWNVLSDILPDLQFDAMSLGNHEFDDGVELLSNYLKYLTSPPVVTCNINFSEDRFLQNASISSSKVFKKKGIEIAVIGYITPESKNIGNTGNVSFDDEIDCLRSEVVRLKASNIDIIIALGHSGYDIDKRIASEIPGIDLVVGGHSHTFLWNGTDAPSKEKISGNYPTWVENSFESEGEKISVPVVQAYAYTKYLGFLKLHFQKKETNGKAQLRLKSAYGNPILLSSKEFSEDPLMKDKIMKWKIKVDEYTNRQVGVTKLFLEGDGSICRQRECNLGNLITDAFVDYIVRNSSNNAMIPIAFVHSGSIRCNIDAPNGTIFYDDILSAIPFSNQLVHVKLKGKVIYELFEHSISAIEHNLGRFLQVSGLKIKYDISKPVGKRVLMIHSRCRKCQSRYKPVLNNLEYEAVTVHELIQGVDDFSMLKNTSVVNFFGVTDLEAVLQYLKIHSPVYPELEGRIKFSRH